MNTKQAIVLITPSSGGKDYFLEILEKKLKEMGKEVSNIKFAVMTRQITMNLLFKQLEEEKIITKEEKEEEIMIITKIPKFVGKNLKIYGPYEPGTKVKLPKEIAEILIKKEKAKKTE